MSDEAARQIVRNLGRSVERAVMQHGAVETIGAIRSALADLDAGGAGCSCGGGSAGRANEVERRRPRSGSFQTAAEYRDALDAWNRWRRERTGPAIRRGRPPPIVTRPPDDD